MISSHSTLLLAHRIFTTRVTPNRQRPPLPLPLPHRNSINRAPVRQLRVPLRICRSPNRITPIIHLHLLPLRIPPLLPPLIHGPMPTPTPSAPRPRILRHEAAAGAIKQDIKLVVGHNQGIVVELLVMRVILDLPHSVPRIVLPRGPILLPHAAPAYPPPKDVAVAQLV